MRIKRLIYFLYYLRELDRGKFRKFLLLAKQESGKSTLSIVWDVVYSSLKYNISILDYFYFRFYELHREEWSKWAGTGYMYEFQLKMNPRSDREILENKIRFLKHFSSFVKRDFADFNQMKTDPDMVASLLGNSSGRLVLKNSRGQVGAEVEVIRCEGFTPFTLLNMMKLKGYDLAEEFVVQHPALMALSSSGLNTLRIITQRVSSQVYFLGARLRVSVNSHVDNMAAGNMAAPVDIDTGVVIGPGVYSDITKSDAEIHPITGMKISDFQVPFWQEVKEMARQAALKCEGNRSVGWDIAITRDGPELIEGNHNWCKLLWQLPVKKGLKEELAKFN